MTLIGTMDKYPTLAQLQAMPDICSQHTLRLWCGGEDYREHELAYLAIHRFRPKAKSFLLDVYALSDAAQAHRFHAAIGRVCTVELVVYSRTGHVIASQLHSGFLNRIDIIADKFDAKESNPISFRLTFERVNNAPSASVR